MQAQKSLEKTATANELGWHPRHTGPEAHWHHMHTGTRISVICTLRRRGGRSGALSRRSSLLSAAAALQTDVSVEQPCQPIELRQPSHPSEQPRSRDSRATDFQIQQK